MIEIRIKGDKEMARKFKEGAKRAQSTIYKSMQKITSFLAGYVKRQKLTGQVLRVRTGRLRNSITSKVEVKGNEVIGRVGTNVEYGRIWELGGTIPAYTIRPKRAMALKFEVAGDVVFCKRVYQPARQVKARPYLQPSVKENMQKITKMLGDAYKALIQ